MSIVDNKEQEIMNIDLSPIRRQKFSIDGDVSRLLELNVTDMGLVTRLNEVYPKLQALTEEHAGLEVKFNEEGELEEDSFNAIGQAIKDLDTKMREYMDYIFDSNVSEMCAPSGTMFDLINGSYRFEFILDVLAKLYETEISKSIQKRKDSMTKHTAKYTKSRARKK